MPKKAAASEAEVLTGAARFGRAKKTLKMGLVGLPNVGKSSLFNLLTEQSAAAENYPFCTIEPSEARCPVPDKRYDKLCHIWKPPSTICSYLMVTDIAGLIKGASEGAGLGNAFLSTIGACDGIYHVVRAFDNDEILHVEETVDPVRDMEIIHGELCAKDLQFVQNAILAEAENVKKKRSSAYKTPEAFTSAYEKCVAQLEAKLPLRDIDVTTEELGYINERCHNQLLTTKPVIFVVNLNAKDIIRKKNKYLPKIKAWIDEHGGGLMIPFSVEHEQERWDVKCGGDAAALKALDDEAPGAHMLPRIIKQGFKQLNLMNFFTTGATEVRAWMVYAGATAPQAAGVIHTDFERGFIKADVCSYLPDCGCTVCSHILYSSIVLYIYIVYYSTIYSFLFLFCFVLFLIYL